MKLDRRGRELWRWSLFALGLFVGFSSASAQGTLRNRCLNPRAITDCIRCGSDTWQRAIFACDGTYNPPTPFACDQCGGNYLYLTWPYESGCYPSPFQTQTELNRCLDQRLQDCYVEANHLRRRVINECRQRLNPRQISGDRYQGSPENSDIEELLEELEESEEHAK